MLWNVAGWMGMGIYSMVSHHHDKDGDYCEMEFCYCELSEGETICTCHHPEVQREMSRHGDHHDDSDQIQMDLCYYTTPHTSPDSSTNIITWEKSQTTLVSTKAEVSYFVPLSLTDKNYSFPLSGYPEDLLRPPAA
jgi:hypothetical protein